MSLFTLPNLSCNACSLISECQINSILCIQLGFAKCCLHS
uniref:Uncharacterized protein n=1 Tax=Arundo donax TaxID=35708 RepID=A0A0A9AQV3_ARUDO